LKFLYSKCEKYLTSQPGRITLQYRLHQNYASPALQHCVKYYRQWLIFSA
jgi:hypothetical protein